VVCNQLEAKFCGFFVRGIVMKNELAVIIIAFEFCAPISLGMVVRPRSLISISSFGKSPY
jgi:hypothetical protein